MQNLNRNSCQIFRYGIILLLFFNSCATKPIPDADAGPPIILTDSIDEKQALQRFITEYKEQLEVDMDEVIGRSEKELTKNETESTLGNFIADVMRMRSNKYYDGEVDAAVVALGELQGTLPAGELQIRDVYEVVPFDNTIHILELSGDQIMRVFKVLAKRKDLAVSNSLVIIKNDKVEQVFVGGRLVDHDKKYIVAISNKLTEVGDGLLFLKDLEQLKHLEIRSRDLVIDHIKALDFAGEKIDAGIEGRVKIL